MATDIPDGKDYGHKQMTVIQQIQGILEKYPFGNQILKEIIQNGDDAGADEVKFMLDLDSHSEEESGLINPGLAKYQGPALYSWNNATFQEQDWKGVEETGRSTKKEDFLKVGRFGLGFISMYHITDCPWILSKNDISYLDPQNIADSGRRYSLATFFTKQKYSSHHSCFMKHYFGYEGGAYYDGTIFRFPLKTGSYESSISNETHSPDEIKKVLFTPLIEDGEHILPFLKYVHSIEIFEKQDNKVSLIHSVGVSAEFRKSLNKHRKEITLFAEERRFYDSTGLFITVYPIASNERQSLWIVLNLIGFGARLPGNAENAFYKFYTRNTLKYIPWFGIAMPICSTDCSVVASNHTWRFDWKDSNFGSILEFIQSNVGLTLPIHPDATLSTNSGKYYCFLPIPKDSLFPFHLQGYFALDDNRRSLKWPSSYDRSLDAEWNKFQTEMLGSTLYATFLHLTIQCIDHSQPAAYHYKLWADLNRHEPDDSLFSLIQREGLRLLLREKLAFSQAMKWIALDQALYTPSVIPEIKNELWTNDNENCCIKLLLSLSQPIVDMPPNVTQIITSYQFLREVVEPRIITPMLIRNIIKSNSAMASLREFIANRHNAILLLEVILSDLDTSTVGGSIAAQLSGIPLIIVADLALEPQTFIASKDETLFISENTPKFLAIFPGLERLFVDPLLPKNIHQKLLKLARETDINIQDITDIDHEIFTSLLTRFFKEFFNSITSPLTWTPGCNGQPRASWVRYLWDFIGSDQTLLHAAEDFPLLPNTSLSSNSIQLLAVKSQGLPYIEFDQTREPTVIEDILTRIGCSLCHRNSFIQCFDDIVLRPVPHCLIVLFKNESILTQFIALLSETDANTRRDLIELLNTLSLEEEDYINRLKRLPIYLNFRQEWLSLCELIDQKSPILAPRTILEGVSYPRYILTPFDSQLVLLYQKLGVSSVSEETFIQKNLVPFMISSELHNSPESRNSIAFWILDRLPNFQLSQGDELLEYLKDTRWLVDSSTPHDKMGQEKLFKPASMLDPLDPVLKHLIMKSNEGFFPNNIYDNHVEKMKKYFQFKSYTDLNSRLRKEVCKAAVSNLRSYETHAEWIVSFKSLLQLISHYFDQCELQNENNFWKEFNKAFVLPQNKISKYFPLDLPFQVSGTLCFPSQTIVCTIEQVSLIAYASNFVLLPHIIPQDNEASCSAILKCMGFQVDIPCEVVINHLNHIIAYAQQNDAIFSDASLYTTVSAIYDHLNPQAMHFENLFSCFVLVKDRREFVEVSRIAETTPFLLEPYIYSCSRLNYKCIGLFSAMGMPPSPTLDQYCTILSDIHTKSADQPVSQPDLEIVLDILALIACKNLGMHTIYIPGHDNVLYASDNEMLVFSDEKWLDRTHMCSEYSFIFAHESITKEIALKLGISRFYDRGVTSRMYRSADMQTPVIHAIKSIMDAYTDELGVLREMVQNSDDSGANEMKILFDFRSHPSHENADNASLLSKPLHHWQGPAIWFYNNKRMDDCDFENILSVAGYGKANDVTKIGRDGTGFCSVFRMTDLPSFVSGDRVCIMDPHGEYIEQSQQTTACTINFCEKEFVKCYKDQFEPFQGIFGCRILDNEFYESTLFRLPLRPRDLKSLLSVKCYNQEDTMVSLQVEFAQHIEDMLLFTQNLVSIEICQIRTNTFTDVSDCIARTFCVRKDVSSGLNQSFLSPNRVHLEEILQGKCVDYETSFIECKISSSNSIGQKEWLLCYSTAGGDFADVIKIMRAQRVRIHVPFAAVAFNLDKMDKQDIQCKSELFSFHSLQMPLLLPYHCHGMFELSNNKMNLHPIQGEDYKLDWNSIMISLNLMNAVSALLSNLAERSRNRKGEELDRYCQFLYNVFSIEMCDDPIWESFCEQIVDDVMEESSSLFPITSSDGSGWGCFSEIVILDELDLQNQINPQFSGERYLESIRKFLIGLGYKLALIPSDLFKSSGLIHLLLQSADEERIMNTTKFVENFFNSLPSMSHSLMMELLPGLIASCSKVKGLSDLISTTPCIPCGELNIIPALVIDPNNRILSDLYKPSENRFPILSCHGALFDPQSTCYIILKNDFNLISDKLPLKDVLDRGNKIVEEADIELADRLLTYLNLGIFSTSEAAELQCNLSSLPFLPTLSPQVYPMVPAQQPKLTPPNRATLFSLRIFLGLQQPILSQETCKHEQALKLINISPISVNGIETEALLQEIIETKNNYEHLRNSPEDLLDKLVSIYRELARRMDKEREYITTTLTTDCVYIPEFGFVNTGILIINHERSFSPYIHTLQQFYKTSETKLKRFFSEIKIEQTITKGQCLQVLSELSLKCETHLNESDEAMAIKIIEELAKCKDIYDDAFLLGEDIRIHKSSNCVFYDLKWKEKEGYQGQVKINSESYFFVHPQISNATASKLGAISLSSSIKVVTNRLKFKYAVKGQRESLVRRLKDIVGRYEATVEVFKELLQNSDDAKAKTVKVLFDYSHFGCESLINEKMALFQGPSLYVFNDRQFSNDDFKSILEIAGETKKDDTTKIGRFGLGFNTVYHLTDVPSFVSRGLIHFLDPHYFSDEPGLSIDFTENEKILRECYSDQFSVFNVFGCDVFSTQPYDGTLFRFPFRTSKCDTQIKPTGVFDTKNEIEELQKSFLNIIEQLIFFLQHVQTIEVYERQGTLEDIKLICKVNKTFKIKPYASSFLSHYEDHFKELRESSADHVTAIEVVDIEKEVNGQKTSEEFILSHASGTAQCLEVINKFKELREASVCPISSVGIPRRLLLDSNRDKKDEFKLFCFLPIPKESPYNMHINGYFHLNSYRTELHVTDANAHLTQWNCSLINDALPNALIALILKITTEIISITGTDSLTDKQLENYFSFWPLSSSNEKPWSEYTDYTASKIIDFNCPIFPCALHHTKWLTFEESSFLNEHFIRKDFNQFLRKFAAQRNVFFVDIPSCLVSKPIFKLLFKESRKTYDIERICVELIFPNLEAIKDESLDDLKLVISNLVDLYSNHQNTFLKSAVGKKSPLCELEFIPCGDTDPVLKKPCKVIHPESRFSPIYYPEDRRLPHSDFHEWFSSAKYRLAELGVLDSHIPEEDLIDRCEVAQTIYSEDKVKGKIHAMILLKYMNELEAGNIPDPIRSLAFVPVWNDPLFTHLGCVEDRLMAPQQCVSYSCRHVITHKYCAVGEDVDKLGKAMKNLKIESCVADPEIIIELLEVLSSKQNEIKDYDDSDKSFDVKIKRIFRWLADYCFPESDMEKFATDKQDCPVGTKQEHIKESLRGKPWIWHPSYKEFYPISLVSKTSDFLKFKSKYLISFPYPELFKDNPKCNISYFFKFMGMNQSLGHQDALEILHSMRNGYKEKVLEENDFDLAVRLITEIIGKHFDYDSDETPPGNATLISEGKCLHPANCLYRNDIQWMESSFSDEDIQSLVHHSIPALVSHRLGAMSKRSTFFEDQSCDGITREDFGPNEDIKDRIENIKSQIKCDVTIMNELLQNAEDSGATEIAFILDFQKYQSEHLCFSSDTHRKWQSLQSQPSLLVYNNRAFTAKDIEGIQKVGIGGKRSLQTIGRFGIGFNSVYHLTRSPCLLTSPANENHSTFCIFDPYREYLNIPDKSKLPGKKIIIRNDKRQIFKDQLQPYEIAPITQNEDFCDMLTNLRSDCSYSLFRFPLTAKHCNIIEATEKILEDFLNHARRILIFLKHIKRIDVLTINEDGKVLQKLSLKSESCKHPNIPQTIRSFYPGQYLRNVTVTLKKLSSKTWKVSKPNPRRATNEVRSPDTSQDSGQETIKISKEENEWLCYNHEDSVENFPGHEKFKDKIETEKLKVMFGSLALNISRIVSKKEYQRNLSYIFCYLPIGTSFDFPIHINAPLIVDPHRQFLKFSERGQEAQENSWEYNWHVAVIKNVLVPLYCKLLIDLSDRQLLALNNPAEQYYRWFYSLFPMINKQQSSNNAHFLEMISREVYRLLHQSETCILVNNDMSGDYLHSFVGENQGVFKIFPGNEQYQKLYSILEKIRFPLTCAPENICKSLQSLELKYQSLDPIHLANFLVCHKNSLAMGSCFPCELQGSVLDYDEVVLLLKFVLSGDREELKGIADIPLKIDSGECLSSFVQQNGSTYLSTYAALLPHCSADFIHPGIPEKLVQILTELNFIKPLEAKFLAENIQIDETFTEDCYLLFWQFAIKECKSIEQITELFGERFLVPVYHRGEVENSKSYYKYSVSSLSCLASKELEKSDRSLCVAFKSLDCPFLNLKYFDQNSPDFEEIELFLNRHSISKTEKSTVYDIMGCLREGRSLEAELFTKEAEHLRKILSNLQLRNPKDAEVVSELRIFLTTNGKLKSLSSFDVCYVNEHNFKMAKAEINQLESDGIGVFTGESEKGNPVSLIKNVCNLLNLTLVDTGKFVSQYIIPRLANVAVKEQKCYLTSISKVDKRTRDALINQLRSVPFIRKSNSEVRVTADQLFSPSVELFNLCLEEQLLPNEWGDEPVLIGILSEIGFNIHETLPILRDCAVRIADGILTDKKKINRFLDLFVNFFSSLQFSQNEVSLLDAIAEINFIPVKKILKIAGNKLEFEEKLGNFLMALPHENLSTCGMVCYILPSILSKLSEGIKNHLRITSKPKLSLVLGHLELLSQQCQDLPSNEIVEHSQLFYDSYTFLQEDTGFTPENITFKCILNQGTFLDPINLVFDIEEEISPYLLKVPTTLLKYRIFLERLGVEKTPTYLHFMEVLKLMHNSIDPNHLMNSKTLKESAQKAFSALIKELRMIPPNNPVMLDPTDTYVLTDELSIHLSEEVFYADNTSLLAIVRKDTQNLKIHILKTLPPDQYGSGIPPPQLQIKNLSGILTPSLSSTTSQHQVSGHAQSKHYTDILQNPLFHRCLMRLYFHETNKNIRHLKIKDGQLYYSETPADYPSTEGYTLVLDRIKSLTATAVTQIHIELRDERTDQCHVIAQALRCFIDCANEILYIDITPFTLSVLPTFVANELNSFLANIYSQTKNVLQMCFSSGLCGIMTVLDEFEIKQCPFLDEIQLPQHFTPPTPIPPATIPFPTAPAPPTYAVPPGPVTLYNLLQHRTQRRVAPGTRPRPGVDMNRADLAAAKLWIRTAQCDLKAANRLNKKSDGEATVFPPQACFLCFEATMKALIAVLHFYGGCEFDLYFERNLCILAEEVKHLFPENVYEKLRELIIPLMNFDEPTRLPCMTSGIGFYTPREHFTLEMARSAIKSVKKILHRLKEGTKTLNPNLESLMLEEGEGGFIEAQACLSLTEMLNFQMERDLDIVKLETDTEEFFTVARSFFATMPQAKIISIEKVKNRKCWDNFRRNVEHNVSKYGDGCLMIRPLFHGTRDKEPRQIYNHDVGFCTDFAGAGMWGSGLYFAVNSSYSDRYAHQLGNGEFCMFLAQVFVGFSEEKKADGSIVGPKGGFQSVTGNTFGSQIYILYSNGLAYPSYLITYSR